jgi:hypothetical protein
MFARPVILKKTLSQSTVEYLVILSMTIIIILVIAQYVYAPTSSVDAINTKARDAALRSFPIGISAFAVNETCVELKILNNVVQKVNITKIVLNLNESAAITTSIVLQPGQEQLTTLCNMSRANGSPYDLRVSFTYKDVATNMYGVSDYPALRISGFVGPIISASTN